MSALHSCGLLLVVLEVFAEQFESRRDAQIQHHRVRRLVHVVFDGRGCRGDVVLRQARAIVGHVDGKRFDSRFLTLGSLLLLCCGGSLFRVGEEGGESRVAVHRLQVVIGVHI